MGSVRTRSGKYIAEAVHNGKRISKTHATKKAAWAWVTAKEQAMESGELPNKTFGDLLQRYSDTVSPKKRGAKWEYRRIELLRLHRIAAVRLSEITPNHIAEWRDSRLKDVSASTVLREWNLLSHACSVAVREWGWLKANPMSTVSRPPEPPPRTRRPTEQEIKRLILASGYDYDTAPETIAAKTAACFLLAIETAMRAGEICALEWKNVHTNHVHLPMTKNGTSRDVPLSSEAKRIINQMGGGGLVFGVTTRQIDANFRKLKKRAVIDGLTFHDSRREALTRLAKKLDVMELAKVSGHKDLKILLQVYYAPTIGDLANKLD